jgi:hypothetical protein
MGVRCTAGGKRNRSSIWLAVMIDPSAVRTFSATSSM